MCRAVEAVVEILVCVCVWVTSKEAKVEMKLAEMESESCGAEEASLVSGGEQRWRSN